MKKQPVLRHLESQFCYFVTKVTSVGWSSHLTKGLLSLSQITSIPTQNKLLYNIGNKCCVRSLILPAGLLRFLSSRFENVKMHRMNLRRTCSCRICWDCGCCCTDALCSQYQGLTHNPTGLGARQRAVQNHLHPVVQQFLIVTLKVIWRNSIYLKITQFMFCVMSFKC